jgi:hypothetical protein
MHLPRHGLPSGRADSRKEREVVAAEEAIPLREKEEHLVVGHGSDEAEGRLSRSRDVCSGKDKAPTWRDIYKAQVLREHQPEGQGRY